MYLGSLSLDSELRVYSSYCLWPRLKFVVQNCKISLNVHWLTVSEPFVLHIQMWSKPFEKLSRGVPFRTRLPFQHRKEIIIANGTNYGTFHNQANYFWLFDLI
jgi:hypothetical protein